MRENYNDYKDLVEEYLIDFIPKMDRNSETLYDAMVYSLKSGGKRLRPVLLLAAMEFAGGNSKDALPYACAIEYIHTYSLIHDDLPAMDDDDLRRGEPTNHKVFGDAMAILAGDALLNTAFEIMTKNMMLYFDNPKELKKRIKAMYAISKAAGIRGMVAGQASDIENENCRCSAEMLEFIHINKTSALITSAVRAGLYLADADEKIMRDLTIFAEKLGFAFQIADDILDVEGSAEKLGKRVGSDAMKDKSTYVSLYGLDKAKEFLTKLTDEAVDVIAPYYDNAEFFRELVLKLANRES